MMPLSRARALVGRISPLPTGNVIRLVTSGDAEDSNPKNQSSGRIPTAREDLPYKIEIWNETATAVEPVIAVTANASIGYAAYYAATCEYPDRHITLRHKNSVVVRWRGPKH